MYLMAVSAFRLAYIQAYKRCGNFVAVKPGMFLLYYTRKLTRLRSSNLRLRLIASPLDLYVILSTCGTSFI